MNISNGVNFKSRIIKIGVVVLGLVVAVIAFAQVNPFDIEFPIPELGNCASLEDCELYCDDPANANSCSVWAENQGIQVVEHSEDFEERAHELLEAQAGPGGCQGFDKCEAYCNDPSNGEECLNFAVQNGFLSQREADEIREHGFGDGPREGPGGCTSSAECEAFCDQPENHSTCIDFAEREGYMTAAEAAQARKHAGRTGPGGCSSERSCDVYCTQPGHEQECIQFAVAEGFMTQEEANRILQFILEGGPGRHRGPQIPGGPGDIDIDVEKVLRLLEVIDGPGGCSTFEECETFCSVPANDEVCVNFALEHDLFTGDVEDIRRLINIEGPGGCRGQECEVYCDQPGNELECLDFAVAEGFMTQEEYEEIKRFVEATAGGGPGGCQGRECETHCNNPANQDECFAFAKEHGLIPPEEIEALERIDSRLKESGGPGGCTNENECRIYCSDPSNLNECAAFATDVGLVSPEQAKQMLQQFINIEQYGPGGIPEGFGPPPGFEAEFERRFEQEFERYRQEFESGGFPSPGVFPGPGQFPPPTEFPGEAFPGVPPTSGFPTPSDFPGGVPSGFSLGQVAESSRGTLTINPATGLYVLSIVDPQGIQEFSFIPTEGSIYSGTIGCPTEYKTETSIFGLMTFPYTSYVIDCSGNKTEFTVYGEGGFPGPPPTQFAPPTSVEEGIQLQIQEETQRQIQEQIQLQQQQLLPSGKANSTSLFAIILAPFLNLFR